MNQNKIAYISFDLVPAPKGAAIHITAFSIALASAFGELQLVTVSPTTQLQTSEEISPQIKQTMLPAIGNNLINRVLYFRQMLRGWLAGKRFAAIHIRSIFEGFVIATNKDKFCDKLIFEVNGLPSIELKYRYPAVVDDRDLMYKIYSQEQICLDAADLIITPSSVTAKYLQKRGIAANKIKVIPNGVNLDVFTNCGKFHQPNKPSTEILKMIYFGTISAWQGVNLAVEALGLINRDFPASLTIIGQTKNAQIQILNVLANKLNVADKLTILEPVSQEKLVEYIHQSDIILAPLTASDRNLIQGCCPLKVLEGMATGIPVIASDLAVVRELGENGTHFLLVKPGSAKAIKDAVFLLHHHPELVQEITTNARKQIENNYTWEKANLELINAYEELGIKRLITSSSCDFS